MKQASPGLRSAGRVPSMRVHLLRLTGLQMVLAGFHEVQRPAPERIVDAAKVWQRVGGWEEHRGQALALPRACSEGATGTGRLWRLRSAGRLMSQRPCGPLPAPASRLLPPALLGTTRPQASPTQSPSSSSSAVMRPSSPECSLSRRSSASTMGLATLPAGGAKTGGSPAGLLDMPTTTG